jgi:hypothetical protein
MKRIINLKVVALFALFVVVTFAAGVFSASVQAHEGHDDSKVQAQTTQAQTQSTPQTSNEVTYQYVAQTGDSYSLIARKAVQTYGLSSKTKLSRAQIIYVETHLTLEAGSPELNVGQKVGIKESSVRSWAEKADKLTPVQEKAWDTYAQYADFNTNHVGEAAHK